MKKWVWRDWYRGEWYEEDITPARCSGVYNRLKLCRTLKDFADVIQDCGAAGVNLLQLHDGQCIVGLNKNKEFKWKVYPDLDAAMVAVELNWDKGD